MRRTCLRPAILAVPLAGQQNVCSKVTLTNKQVYLIGGVSLLSSYCEARLLRHKSDGDCNSLVAVEPSPCMDISLGQCIRRIILVKYETLDVVKLLSKVSQAVALLNAIIFEYSTPRRCVIRWTTKSTSPLAAINWE